MKKIINYFRAILAIAIMLCVALPTLASDFRVDGIYYFITDKTAKTVAVTSHYDDYVGGSFPAASGHVVIPSSVTYMGTTYSVTSIHASAFYDAWNAYDLISVTIPNSVTKIGNGAFDDCDNLTSVTIGNSVTTIGKSAFDGCRGLTEVNISDLSAWCKIDFSSYDTTPLYYAKKLKLNGSEIKDLVIPNDITEIKNYAFYGCKSLTSVTIPNSVTEIGSSAFSYCSGLTKLILEDGTESISGLSFPSSPIETLYLGRNTSDTFVKGKTTLKEVAIGNSVTSIGFSAFEGCTGLTEVNITDLSAWCKIDFGNSYANPLSYAKKLKLNGAEIKDLVIPNDITEIKNSAFEGCTSLTSITLPNSITSISERAFSGCTGLTSVIIGDSVSSIGASAFYGCSNLIESNNVISPTSVKVNLNTLCSSNLVPCIAINNKYYLNSAAL